MKIQNQDIFIDAYRYGFNGMEKDDELKGGGNSYTSMFRQYDPRLGRWLSIDPLASNFPWQSPYVGMDNNPIYLKDPNGDSTWVDETDESITINTTIEFTGNGLYKKDGTLRDGAQARVDMITDDIKKKWDGTEFEGKTVNVNIMTKLSKQGGSDETYDQITVHRGRGRSYIQVTDKNGIEIAASNNSTSAAEQAAFVKQVRNGANYFRIQGHFYLNTPSGTYGHEYGHMIGYWDDDYTDDPAKVGPFDRNSGPKEEFMRPGLMYTPYGRVLPIHINRIMNLIR